MHEPLKEGPLLAPATKTLVIVAIALVVCLVLLFVLFVEWVPPVSSTHGTLWVLRQRIALYVAEHDELPADLSRLPRIPKKGNETVDGWGREIIYSHDESGMVTLCSYGADGKEGGQNEDEDMIGTFNPFQDEGSWISEPNLPHPRRQR